jgi:hypothetical protein
MLQPAKDGKPCPLGASVSFAGFLGRRAHVVCHPLPSGVKAQTLQTGARVGRWSENHILCHSSLEKAGMYLTLWTGHRGKWLQ